MLYNVGLLKDFWADAVFTACYLLNRSLSTTIECKTHIEVWYGKPAEYNVFKVFSCPALLRITLLMMENFIQRKIKVFSLAILQE